jgi:hypothetical protein
MINVKEFIIGCGIIEALSRYLPGSAEENQRTFYFRVVFVVTEVRTGYIPNTSQKRHSFGMFQKRLKSVVGKTLLACFHTWSKAWT